MTKKMKYYMRGLGVGIVVCALVLAVSRMNRPADISDQEVVSRALALGMIDPGNLSLSDAADLSSQEGQVTQIDNPGGIQVIVNDEDITSQTGSASEGDNTSPDAGNTPDENPVTGRPDESSDTGNESSSSGDTDTVAGDTDDKNDQSDTADNKTDTDVKDDSKTDTDTKEDSKTDLTDTGDNKTDPADSGENKTDPSDNDSGNNGSSSKQTVTLEVFRGNSSDVVASRAQSLGLVDDAADFDRYLVSNGYANRISVGSFSIEKGADYSTIARIITNS